MHPSSDVLDGFRFDGRRAVVTGALGKIGRGIAEALACSGARVMGIDVAGAPAELPFELRDADVSRPADAKGIAETLATDFGYDLWVNCAYPRTADWGVGPAEDSAASWDANVSMQMTAACVAADAAAAAIGRRGGGAVLNVASIYGLVGPDFSIYQDTSMTMPAAYAAIKGGMISHTRFLAAYYGPQGVRVNAIAPGGVEAGQPDAFVTAYSNRTALKRMARIADLVGPSLFLLSDAAAYVTGVTLPVDGGWTAI